MFPVPPAATAAVTAVTVRVLPDLAVIQDLQGLADARVRSDLWGRRDLRVNPVCRDIPDPQDRLVRQELPGLSDLRDLQALQEPLVLPDLPGLPDLPELQLLLPL